MARELDRLPPDGLVVDVRGNGGGNIVAAEAALQLLTPRPIAREGLQFLATPHTRAMAEEPWASSIDQAGAIGERYSLAHPLAEDDEWAELTAIGQVYQGPKVLIVDALSYSATDIFAAGWQDNAIGPVVGTDARTGAGGANVWSYRVVRRALREGTSAGPGRMTLPALPGGASLRVAVRRSLRVGASAGTPLEGLGVAPAPDDVLSISLRDALGDGEGRAQRRPRRRRGPADRRRAAAAAARPPPGRRPPAGDHPRPRPRGPGRRRPGRERPSASTPTPSPCPRPTAPRASRASSPAACASPARSPRGRATESTI